MKILVVGCGSIGRRHARNARDVAEVAVTDLRRENASRVARELGTQFFSDLPEALSWKPQAVVVATPTDRHLTVASAALESGAHVLIEKPLAHSMQEVETFLKMAEGSGRKAFVVCNMRFHPGVSTLMTHLAEVGKVLFARAHVGNHLPAMRPGSDYRELYCAHRSQGGGVILDAIHEIDYLMWMLGPVIGVTCAAAKLSDLKIDVEDFACICLKHPGAVAEIQMDYLRPFKRRGCEIVGTRGMLIWESEGKLPENCTVRRFSIDSGTWETLFSDASIDTNGPYARMMHAFLDAIDGKNHSPMLTAATAAEELSVTLRALELGNLWTREGGGLHVQ